MSNTEELLKHLDTIITGLEGIKTSLEGKTNNNSTEKTEKVEIDTEVLADRLANSYTTLHPEYRVDSQFRNLQEMVKNSNKVSILFSWLKKHPDGIEDFFKLPQYKRQEILDITLSNHGELIKDILTKRFSTR